MDDHPNPGSDAVICVKQCPDRALLRHDDPPQPAKPGVGIAFWTVQADFTFGRRP
ncbi:MAG: hypothetical protein WD767_02370 [Alphaproteobacteria bacterium]